MSRGHDTNYRVIIFGCGHNGKLCLDFIGPDRVSFFIDNSGVRICEQKKVISFREYLECSDNNDMVIVSPNNCDDIIQSLKKAHIDTFVTRREMIDYYIYDRFEPDPDYRNKDLVVSHLELIKSELGLKKTSKPGVEFFVVDSFEISHFEVVFSELRRKGVDTTFVVEYPWLNPVEDWLDYKTAVRVLKQKRLQYVSIPNCRAKVAITTQYARVLEQYQNAKKIQFCYGLAMLKTAAFNFFDGVAESFDYVFVHGELQKHILETKNNYLNAVVFSYPRYLNRIREDNSVQKKREKTILYLPTWDEFSSIPELCDQFESLKEAYRIVVKPHHCTYRLKDKEKDMTMLRQTFPTILDGTSDLYDAVSQADICVCDAKSGALGEAAFLNNDLKMLVVYKNCSPEDFYFNIEHFAWGMNTSDCLGELIDQLNEKDPYIIKRKQILDTMCSPDIRGGLERAVSLISSICSSRG